MNKADNRSADLQGPQGEDGSGFGGRRGRLITTRPLACPVCKHKSHLMALRPFSSGYDEYSPSEGSGGVMVEAVCMGQPHHHFQTEFRPTSEGTEIRIWEFPCPATEPDDNESGASYSAEDLGIPVLPRPEQGWAWETGAEGKEGD